MNALARMALGSLNAYSHIAPTERGGFRLVRLARRFVPRNQWHRMFRVPAGFELSLDLATYPDCCMAVGLFELDTDRQIRRHLRPGQWFVDCGANIGYFSLLAAHIVGETGRVDAIEPDPVNREQLERHLLHNGMTSRVRVRPVAVADRAGSIELYHPDTADMNHGQASLYASLVPAAKKYNVEMVRLDDCLDGVPDLIKMDIEGAELSAIKGMSRILASPRPPKLIVEHNPEACAAAGHRPGDIFDTLLSLQPRYRIYWIGWRLSRITSAEQQNRISRLGNLLVQAEDAP